MPPTTAQSPNFLYELDDAHCSNYSPQLALSTSSAIRKFLTSTVCLTLMTTLAACPGSTTRTCIIGQEVTIPTSDTSPPSITLDIILPNSTIIQAAANQTVHIPFPTGGDSRNIVVSPLASDPEGIKDVQVWLGTKICTTSGGVVTCAGPGLLGAPTTSNPDSASPGSIGCSQRSIAQTEPTTGGGRSYEVSVTAINFGGQKAEITGVRLVSP